jgi:hypothetical protein
MIAGFEVKIRSFCKWMYFSILKKYPVMMSH